MYRKFLNARSPLRLLEKGLHGGLGSGNIGIVLAGHGVGKTSFLVGVAMDELLREGRVLHVSLSHTVSHVRAHYDTVYEELTFAPRLYRRFAPNDHDITVTCSYPFTNWVLRLKGRRGRPRVEAGAGGR